MGLLDYGDVPTWLATSGAGLAVFFASRAYRAEVARDQRAEAMLAQSQAARIAVWDGESIDQRMQNPWGRESLPRIMLRNASDLPVYEVRVFSYRFRWKEPAKISPSGEWSVGVLPPTTEPLPRLAVEDKDADSHVYAIEFRDAAGRVWHRDREGVLHEGPLTHEPGSFTERLWDEDW